MVMVIIIMMILIMVMVIKVMLAILIGVTKLCSRSKVGQGGKRRDKSLSL